MNTNRNFPINLSEEEVKAGFKVITNKFTASDSGTQAAVLYIDRSRRLLKVYDDFSNRVEYLLEAFCQSSDPLIKHDSTRWQTISISSFSNLRNALYSATNDSIDANLQLEIVNPPQNEVDEA